MRFGHTAYLNCLFDESVSPAWMFKYGMEPWQRWIWPLRIFHFQISIWPLSYATPWRVRDKTISRQSAPLGKRMANYYDQQLRDSTLMLWPPINKSRVACDYRAGCLPITPPTDYIDLVEHRFRAIGKARAMQRILLAAPWAHLGPRAK